MILSNPECVENSDFFWNLFSVTLSRVVANPAHVMASVLGGSNWRLICDWLEIEVVEVSQPILSGCKEMAVILFCGILLDGMSCVLGEVLSLVEVEP
jgi:hypothetical protein